MFKPNTGTNDSMDCSYLKKNTGLWKKKQFKFHNLSSVCIFSAFWRRGDVVAVSFCVTKVFTGELSSMKVGVFSRCWAIATASMPAGPKG